MIEQEPNEEEAAYEQLETAAAVAEQEPLKEELADEQHSTFTLPHDSVDDAGTTESADVITLDQQQQRKRSHDDVDDDDACELDNNTLPSPDIGPPSKQRAVVASQQHGLCERVGVGKMESHQRRRATFITLMIFLQQ